MKVNIRQIKLEDIDQVAKLQEAVAAEDKWIRREPALPGQEKAALKESCKKIKQEINNTDSKFIRFVAETNARVVGTAYLELKKYGAAELGMYIDQSFRGKGIGKSLLITLITWARKHKFHKIFLEVWPHNHAAIQLYKRFGFSEEGRRRRHYRRRSGQLWDSIIMGLALDTKSFSLARRS